MNTKTRRMISIVLTLVMLLSLGLSNAVVSFGASSPAANERVVRTSDELATALATGTVDKIYLANDITIGKDMPIKNDKTRTTSSVTIYGYNPFNGETPATVKRTLTENTAAGKRIHVTATAGSLKSTGLENIKVVGMNYYGVIKIACAKAIDQYYKDFEYVGPQPTYNPYGNAHYENVKINLIKANGLYGEVAEAINITLAGDVDIVKETSSGGEAFFYPHGKASTITVKKDANVNLVNNKTADLGFYYQASKKGNIIVEDGASFSYTGYKYFLSCSQDMNSFIVGKNANVSINIKNPVHCGTKCALIYAQTLSVGQGASYDVRTQGYTGSYPVLYAATATFDNPAKVVIYNASTKGAAIGAGTLKVTTEEIRHWTSTMSESELNNLMSSTASNGNRYWFNADGSAFTVTNGSFSRYNAGAGTSSTSMYSTTSNVVAYNSIVNVEYAVDEADKPYVTGQVPVGEGKGRAGGEVTIASKGTLDYPGKEFAGWLDKESGNVYLPGQKLNVTRDIILYAAWEGDGPIDDKCDITYYANSGTGGPFTDYDTVIGEEYTFINNHVAGIYKENYVLASWNTEPDGSGTKYLAGDRIILEECIDLYAQWQYDGDDAVSVTYHPNTGEGSRTVMVAPGDTHVVLSDSEVGVIKEFWSFKEWNTLPDGSGKSYKSGDEILLAREPVFLYAIWGFGEERYSISYKEGRYGTGVGKVESGYEAGERYTILDLDAANITPTAPTLIEFKGWQDQSGERYNPGDSVIITGNLVLTAQWGLFDDPMGSPLANLDLLDLLDSVKDSTDDDVILEEDADEAVDEDVIISNDEEDEDVIIKQEDDESEAEADSGSDDE